MSDKAEQRRQAIQAMDFVVDGLQSAQWALVGGYMEHPEIAYAVMQGSMRLFMNALHVYHDPETAAKYARLMIDMLQPFAEQKIFVDEDNWFDSLTPALLEKLG